MYVFSQLIHNYNLNAIFAVRRSEVNGQLLISVVNLYGSIAIALLYIALRYVYMLKA